jgi:DNA mismatch repair ATPase MutL
MDTVLISAKGVKKVLERYKEAQAVAELIWNGFDARADCVKIEYQTNALETFQSFAISDNGYGIDYNLLKTLNLYFQFCY